MIAILKNLFNKTNRRETYGIDSAQDSINVITT